MQVGTAGLARGMDAARGRVAGFAASIGAGTAARFGAFSAAGAMAFTAIAGAAAAAGSAVVGGIGRAIRTGADLSETFNKMDVTFGASAGTVKTFAQDYADRFGLVKAETMDAAAQIGLIGQASGLAQAESAGMAVAMTKLAADLSSFQNLPMDVALEKIRAGLVGEAEPLRTVGVLLSAAAVDAQAASMGLAKVNGKFTEGAKVQARAAIISQQLATSQGDLERTAGSAANQMRAAAGRTQNALADLGMTLQPLATVVLNQFGGALAAVNRFLSANGATIAAWVGTAVGWVNWLAAGFWSALTSIGTIITETFQGALIYIESWGVDFGAIFDTAGMVFRNFGSFAQIAWLKVQQGAINLLEWIGVLPENLSILAGYVAGNWRQLLLDAFNSVGFAIQNLGQNLLNLGRAFIAFLQDPTAGFQFNWTPLLDGFIATAGELPKLIRPELTSMQGEIDTILGEIGAREAARAAATTAGSAATAAAAAVPAAAQAATQAAAAAVAAPKFAGAAQLGTAEARTAILRQRGGAGDPMDRLAKTGTRQLAEQKRTNTLLTRMAGPSEIQEI